MRTPALHLIACEIFDEILLFAQLSPRIRMKWESDDDLNRARDDLVSGNALLGAFLPFRLFGLWRDAQN